MRILARPRVHPTLSVTFQCLACGRVRHLVGRDSPFADGLCMCCVFVPGWFLDPDLRAAIDPEHDGLEVHEREGRSIKDQREQRPPGALAS